MIYQGTNLETLTTESARIVLRELTKTHPDGESVVESVTRWVHWVVANPELAERLNESA